MDKILLSIIIPVYNVEKFVEKCIRSCESQDIPQSEYEIVVVNDGSNDRSLDIVNNLALEFSNIVVYSQANAGLSAARNTGMAHANGEYYMFVDSDDWIQENCLGKLTKKLREEMPEALAICAANVYDGIPKRRNCYPDETPMLGKEFLLRGISAPCAPFSIWKSSLFKDHNLSFYEGIFHEDSELTPRAYYFAKKISFTNEIIYYVYQNENSITRSVNPKKQFDLIQVVCPHLYEFSKIVGDKYKVIYYDMIGMYLNNSLFDIRASDTDSKERLKQEIANHPELFVAMGKSRIRKYRYESVLFKLFPNHVMTIYNIIKKLFA